MYGDHVYYGLAIGVFSENDSQACYMEVLLRSVAERTVRLTRASNSANAVHHGVDSAAVGQPGARVDHTVL